MRLALPVAVVLAIVLAPTPAVRAPDLRPEEPPRPPSLAANDLLGRVPFTFVENLGQWPEETRFLGRRGGGVAVHLERDAIVLQFLQREGDAGEEASHSRRPLVRGVEAPEPLLVANARFVFESLRHDVCLAGREETPTLYNFILGNDPARWRTGVRGYGRVVYEGLYAGVDLLVREGDSSLEYDLLLAPGADLSAVAIRVEGAAGGLRLDEEGALVVSTPLGGIRQPRPKAWEERGEAGTEAVDCGYRLLGGERFGFEAAGRREEFALIVDPQLAYSTYLGGSSWEEVSALAIDSTGAAVVAGYTQSTNFPTQNAFQPSNGAGGGSYDAFLTRLPLNGGPPSYSTYLGGTGDDRALALAIDSTGAAVLAGQTFSTNFPTQNAFQPNFGGGVGGVYDAFVTRLPLNGGPPSYSTYLGGNNFDQAFAVALDATGAAVVAGRTSSLDFPTQNAFQPTNAGLYDAFVTRIPLTGGPPSYSTYLGGSSTEEVHALALDSTGAAVVAGWTFSTDFPTQNAFQPTFGGSVPYADAFVTRIPLTGGPPSYSTYLGGNSADQAFALALDSTGAAVVAGYTASLDFPTQNALQPTFGGGFGIFGDAFVTRLPLTGGPPSYSTYLGGNASEQALALALDSTGAAVVAGYTASSNFPTQNALQPALGGPPFADAFVTLLPLTGGLPSFSTYLGGNADDLAFGLALDSTGAAVVAGGTFSLNFPTQNAFQPNYGGGSVPFSPSLGDAFVSRLEMLPTGVSQYGASSPGCDGPLTIEVTSIPQVANAAFALTCVNAPQNALGILAFSGAPLATPLVIAGVQIWIDPASPLFFPALVLSDGAGVAQVPIPIPALPSLAGGQVYLQFFWLGLALPSPPCPLTGFSASYALAIVVQP